MNATVAAYRYEYPIAELIARFKFGGDLAVGQLLGKLLAAHLLKLPITNDASYLLVPIPLHANRLRERGFNQSHCIAQVLSRRLSIPLADELLRRTRQAEDQKRLDAAQRQANLVNAFEAVDCTAVRVILIDDVITTGATATAAAMALKQRGARDVQLWCVARAI